jgi:hypothetical protein
MTKRICAGCGLEKDVYGGKICQNGHFICKACVPQAGLGTLISGYNPKCPLCSKPLR